MSLIRELKNIVLRFGFDPNSFGTQYGFILKPIQNSELVWNPIWFFVLKAIQNSELVWNLICFFILKPIQNLNQFCRGCMGQRG